MAKRRLADEYDAAQQRGEIAGPRDGDHRRSDRERLPTAGDIGLTRKDVFEAREIRDAIEAQPDLLRSVLDDMLSNGEEPTGKRLVPDRNKRERGKRVANFKGGRPQME